MLNRARKKFTVWATIAMAILVIVLVGAVNIVNWQQTNKRLDDALMEIAKFNAPDGSEFRFDMFPPALGPQPGGSEETENDSSGQEAAEEVERSTDVSLSKSGAEESNESETAPKNETEKASESIQSEAAPENETENAPESTENETENVPESTEYDTEEETAADDNAGNENQDISPGFDPGIEIADRGRASAVVQYASRYSTIVLNSDGSFRELTQEQNLFTEDEAKTLVEYISNSEKTSGYYEEFKYTLSEGIDGDYLVHVLDCSVDLKSLRSLLLTSLLVGLGGLILAFLFVFRMSRLAVEPVRISIEKQKQFITNAGHELKTPLSAIATNMDILSMDLGKNEWVDGTRRQVFRLRKLVGNLVSLSKIEEEENIIEMLSFSFSDMAEECIGEFEGQAEMNGKKIAEKIEPGLMMSGDASTIHQLMGILCDNAIKYSQDEDTIEFSVFRSGKNVCFQSVNNWENDIAAEDLEKLFERFYRGDASRNHDGNNRGYGLGLSIAKAIAEKNHGKLTAEIDGKNRIVFKAVFKAAASAENKN